MTFLGPLTRVVVADLLTSEFGGVNVGDQVRVRLRDDVTDVVLIEA